ncbi:MAG TPA: DUF2865 domain-containing protein [Xanthobacteraceae bacterium]|nr:DUF2865 domain-containing protein [Xanthobacteraceae bacterium]
MTAAGPARAQGFFDFLFGGPKPPPPPPAYNYPPPPPPGLGRVVPPPMNQERVTGGEASTGHGVAFCVRLCDGQHFPLERMSNATPADTCRAICPHATTKVFFGSEIGGAVAQDGQSYTSLPTAFIYRKQLVANCTCTGKDPLGLVSLDVKSDPTLRPGDIVSTTTGLQAYTGKSGQTAAFTPVNPATLPVDIGSATLPAGTSLAPAPPDEPSGTTAQQQNSAQPTAAPQSKSQGPNAPAGPRPQRRPPQ